MKIKQNKLRDWAKNVFAFIGFIATVAGLLFGTTAWFEKQQAKNKIKWETQDNELAVFLKLIKSNMPIVESFHKNPLNKSVLKDLSCPSMERAVHAVDSKVDKNFGRYIRIYMEDCESAKTLSPLFFESVVEGVFSEFGDTGFKMNRFERWRIESMTLAITVTAKRSEAQVELKKMGIKVLENLHPYNLYFEPLRDVEYAKFRKILHEESLKVKEQE